MQAGSRSLTARMSALRGNGANNAKMNKKNLPDIVQYNVKSTREERTLNFFEIPDQHQGPLESMT